MGSYMITAEQGPEKTEDKTQRHPKVRNKDQAKIGDRTRTGAKHLITETQTYTGTIVVLSGVMRLGKE